MEQISDGITLEGSDDDIIESLHALDEGSSIVVSGKLLPNTPGFSITLSTYNEHVALRVAVLIRKNLIGRNFQIKEYWGSEETDTEIPFFLQPGKFIQIQIFIIMEAFLIALNGFHIAKFTHHLPFTYIDEMTIHGYLANAKFEQSFESEYPITLNRTYHIGRLISHENELIDLAYYNTINSSRKSVLSFIDDEDKKEYPIAFTYNNDDDDDDDIDNNINGTDDDGDDDDDDIFDRELYLMNYNNNDDYYDQSNIMYLPLPFYGLFKRGIFKQRYTILIRGRVHPKPRQLIVFLQIGKATWPPPRRILTLKFQFDIIEPSMIHAKREKMIKRNHNNNLRNNENHSNAPTPSNRNTNNEFNVAQKDKGDDTVKLCGDLANALQPKSIFDLEIVRKSTHFDIYINRLFVNSVPYTVNPLLTNTIFVNGDITLYDIEIISD